MASHETVRYEALGKDQASELIAKHQLFQKGYLDTRAVAHHVRRHLQHPNNMDLLMDIIIAECISKLHC
jgi:hypothetical protein